MLLALLVSSACCMGLIFMLRPLARRIGLVDYPGTRKQHVGTVPLIGGVAMFCGFFFGILLVPASLSGLRPLFFASAVLVIVGIFDDFRELSYRTRFAAQLFAGAIMVFWAGVQLTDFGFLLHDSFLAELSFFAIPVTLFCVVGVINALNMADGLDGLSGMLVITALLALLVILLSSGHVAYLSMVAILIACVASFLVFNLRLPGIGPARIFMGDAGSMWLGLLLAWLCIDLSQGASAVMTPVTALWILAVPLIDTVAVMIRRIRSGYSPFAPDRQHLHHLFVRSGFNVNHTVLILALANAVCAGAGVGGLLLNVPEPVMFYSFLSVAFGYYYLTGRAWQTRRWMGHAISDV